MSKKFIMCKATKLMEHLAASVPVLINFVRLYYKEIVAREIALGGISSQDKVLCIGGGPLPCTAMEIAQKTGASVWVIDNDPVAVSKAKQVIKKLGLSEQIQVMCCDGLQIEASKFTVIHIALQVQFQDKIVNNLWRHAPNGARILLRSPRQSLQSLYCVFTNEKLCSSCQTVEQKNCTMNATLLFTKEKEVKFNEKGKLIGNGTNLNRAAYMVR